MAFSILFFSLFFYLLYSHCMFNGLGGPGSIFYWLLGYFDTAGFYLEVYVSHMPVFCEKG